MPGVQGGASAHAGWTVVRHECSSHRFLDPSYLHPICHNFTLQHDRLQSVTTTATKQKIQGEVRRIPIPGTSVYRAAQAQSWSPDSWMAALFLFFRAGSGRNHSETCAGCI